MMWSSQNELPPGKTEHSTDERADTVAFAPDVEDADADDEDDPSQSDADLSDDEDGWGTGRDGNLPSRRALRLLHHRV